MSVVVRELRAGDLEALLALYRHLHADDDPVPASIGAVWNEIICDPAQIYLGAFVGDVLASACNATVIANLTRGGRPYAVVENVVTHADYRRRGIAATVMRQLLARCWSRNCYKVMLQSSGVRGEAHAFYLALGFDSAAKQAFVAKSPA